MVSSVEKAFLVTSSVAMTSLKSSWICLGAMTALLVFWTSLSSPDWLNSALFCYVVVKTSSKM